MTPIKEIGLTSIFQELSQESMPKSYDHRSEDTTCHSQGNILPSKEQKLRRPLGKTQKVLAKLLKEGQAARDVMIIVGVFLLCYLPTWIIACYRSFGGDPSTEVTLSTHCFYSTSVIWNPIIYSIRKQEFRN